MKIEITAELDTQYKALQDKIDALKRGECKSSDIKKISSLLGIYVERDGKYMLRVRRPAGELTVEQLCDTADIMDANNADHAHFSTRQNIQLHGIPAEDVYSTLVALGHHGMVFKGGGGNTFRSLPGSPYAGISKTEVFDTTPYMEAVWEYVFGYEKAFKLGRKIKVGFSSELSDNTNCGVQDLGLMAVVQDGKKGFKIYGGGGLGRNEMLGFVLVPFLPAERALQAVVAAIDLFSEHGDRENRSKARLRFVRQRLGEDRYRQLYLEYLKKTDAPLLENLPEIDYSRQARQAVVLSDEAPTSEAYAGWLQRAVQATRFSDVVSVQLYIRKGIFKAQDLRALATLVQQVGSPEIRLTSQQDAIIPFVHKSALPLVYKMLIEKLPDQAATDGNFDRQIISCIGAGRCPIGIVKAPDVADCISEALDQLFKEYPNIQNSVFAGIIDGIRISGCPSSCGLNQIAAIGFGGRIKKIDGKLIEILQVFIGGNISEDGHYLAVTSPEWWIRASDAGVFTANLTREYLVNFQNGNHLSLRTFMLQKREDFDPLQYI